MGKLVWHGDKVLKKVDDAVIGGIADAMYEPFVLYLTQMLDAAHSPPPSSAGEVPHRLSGGLVKSLMIWAVPSEHRVVCGFTSPYALVLELGGTNLQARPFMGPGLLSQLDALSEAVHLRSCVRFFAGSSPPVENVNLNPLTIEGAEIPSVRPAGVGNVLPGARN